jgi:hypothetical protein
MNLGRPLFLKPLYAQEITGFSQATAKHFFTRRSSIVRFASLRLVTKLLFSERYQGENNTWPVAESKFPHTLCPHLIYRAATFSLAVRLWWLLSDCR